ncbi:hypothetical protein C8J57DRAFT_1492612 [Mycena rebaudengoi]|nr:hypothetical protein C8J57DRAFT_1492612 [Mycena rebaudengoi]
MRASHDRRLALDPAANGAPLISPSRLPNPESLHPHSTKPIRIPPSELLLRKANALTNDSASAATTAVPEAYALCTLHTRLKTLQSMLDSVRVPTLLESTAAVYTGALHKSPI